MPKINKMFLENLNWRLDLVASATMFRVVKSLKIIRIPTVSRLEIAIYSPVSHISCRGRRILNWLLKQKTTISSSKKRFEFFDVDDKLVE